MIIEKLMNELSGAANGRIITGEMIGADFCHDEYPGEDYAPDAVVEVMSTEEAAAVMRLCHANGIPVTVRGAGTGQAGGSVPIKGGIVLSLKGMNKIIALDEAAKTVTVQPGVLLQDIKAAAESHGLYYPPDPGEKTATIGGNAATDAGGPCAVKYGSTRDYVIDAVLVMADGTTETLKSRKELAAVIGSEGTLAVITEITLKLVKKPGADAILLFPFMDAESCIAAAAKIAEGGYEPAVAEYLDTDLVEFSGKVTGNPVFPVKMDGERVGATLMVTLEGDDDDAVMEKLEQIAEMAEELECLDILVGDTPTMKRDFWAAHDAFRTSMESGAGNAFEYNISIPADKMSEMLNFAKALGDELGVQILINAHVLSGGLHIHAVSDMERDSFKALLPRLSAAVYTKCTELGGDVRGEYGIGYAKKEYLTEAAKASFAACKTALDPKGILNPGKVAD